MINHGKQNLIQCILKKKKTEIDLQYFKQNFALYFDQQNQFHFNELFERLTLEQFKRIKYYRAAQNEILYSNKELNINAGVIQLSGTALMMIKNKKEIIQFFDQSSKMDKDVDQEQDQQQKQRTKSPSKNAQRPSIADPGPSKLIGGVSKVLKSKIARVKNLRTREPKQNFWDNQQNLELFKKLQEFQNKLDKSKIFPQLEEESQGESSLQDNSEMTQQDQFELKNIFEQFVIEKWLSQNDAKDKLEKRFGKIVKQLQAGELIADNSLMREYPPSSSVLTTSDCELLLIEPMYFHQVLVSVVRFNRAQRKLIQIVLPSMENSELSWKTREHIYQNFQQKTFFSGCVVLRQGTRLVDKEKEYLYFIFSGVFSVSQISKADQENKYKLNTSVQEDNVIASIGQGQVFGEECIGMAHKKYNFSIQCESEKGKVLCINAAAIEQFFIKSMIDNFLKNFKAQCDQRLETLEKIEENQKIMNSGKVINIIPSEVPPVWSEQVQKTENIFKELITFKNPVQYNNNNSGGMVKIYTFSDTKKNLINHQISARKEEINSELSPKSPQVITPKSSFTKIASLYSPKFIQKDHSPPNLNQKEELQNPQMKTNLNLVKRIYYQSPPIKQITPNLIRQQNENKNYGVQIKIHNQEPPQQPNSVSPSGFQNTKFLMKLKAQQEDAIVVNKQEGQKKVTINQKSTERVEKIKRQVLFPPTKSSPIQPIIQSRVSPAPGSSPPPPIPVSVLKPQPGSNNISQSPTQLIQQKPENQHIPVIERQEMKKIEKMKNVYKQKINSNVQEEQKIKIKFNISQAINSDPIIKHRYVERLNEFKLYKKEQNSSLLDQSSTSLLSLQKSEKDGSTSKLIDPYPFRNMPNSLKYNYHDDRFYSNTSVRKIKVNFPMLRNNIQNSTALSVRSADDARNHHAKNNSTLSKNSAFSENRSMSGLKSTNSTNIPYHGLLQRILRSKSEQDNIDRKILREVENFPVKKVPLTLSSNFLHRSKEGVIQSSSAPKKLVLSPGPNQAKRENQFFGGTQFGKINYLLPSIHTSGDQRAFQRVPLGRPVGQFSTNKIQSLSPSYKSAPNSPNLDLSLQSSPSVMNQVVATSAQTMQNKNTPQNKSPELIQNLFTDNDPILVEEFTF